MGLIILIFIASFVGLSLALREEIGTFQSVATALILALLLGMAVTAAVKSSDGHFLNTEDIWIEQSSDNIKVSSVNTKTITENGEEYIVYSFIDENKKEYQFKENDVEITTLNNNTKCIEIITEAEGRRYTLAENKPNFFFHLTSTINKWEKYHEDPDEIKEDGKTRTRVIAHVLETND